MGAGLLPAPVATEISVATARLPEGSSEDMIRFDESAIFSWRIGSPFPEERLRDKDGFAGIDGAFRFSRDGIAERALEVQEIRGGTTVTISPAPAGF